jgi:hypothetical protein
MKHFAKLFDTPETGQILFLIDESDDCSKISITFTPSSDVVAMLTSTLQSGEDEASRNKFREVFDALTLEEALWHRSILMNEFGDLLTPKGGVADEPTS